VTRSPNDGWVVQQLREATPFGEVPRFLIRDNDSKYAVQFEQVAIGGGIKVIRTPFGSPKANARCERFMGSVRRECLDHMLILTDRQLYGRVKEYVTYYNHARPHQGIGQRIPCGLPLPSRNWVAGKIVSVSVLGGLHHDYRRKDA